MLGLICCHIQQQSTEKQQLISQFGKCQELFKFTHMNSQKMNTESCAKVARVQKGTALKKLYYASKREKVHN